MPGGEGGGGADKTEVDAELLKRKSTSQAAVTRIARSLEKLLTDNSSVSALEAVQSDLQKKFDVFETVCEQLLSSLEETDTRHADITTILEERYDWVTKYRRKIAQIKQVESQKAQDKSDMWQKTLKASMSLSKPDVVKFSGNPKDYSRFLAYITNHVESNVDDSLQRLALLVDLCEGLAYEAVSSLLECKDSDG